jgi:hypothetical protein
MAYTPYRKCHYCHATDSAFIRKRGFERRAWTLFKTSGRMCCPNCQRKGREAERLASTAKMRELARHQSWSSYLAAMEAQDTYGGVAEPVEPYGAPPPEPQSLIQYRRIKAKYPDAVLLFRDGDRYEAFGADAETCYQVLGLKRGDMCPIGLASFPIHALENYLPKLVKAGHRLAICDNIDKQPTPTGYAELQPQGPLMMEPEVIYTAKSKAVRGVQLVPPLEKGATGEVAWPVQCWEVFRFLGERFYVVRDHINEKENPREWKVVHESGLGVGHYTDRDRQKVITESAQAVLDAYNKVGEERWWATVEKSRQRRRMAAHPLPEVYLRELENTVVSEPDMWEDEPYMRPKATVPTPEMEQKKAALKVLGRLLRVDLWSYVDKYVLAISGEVVLDLIALDAHFGKHDRDYDPRECTYNGQPSSMKDYVQQRFGDTAVELFLEVLNHKQAA